MSMTPTTDARTTDAPTTAAAPKAGPKATKAKPTITFSVVPAPVKASVTPTAAPRTTLPPTRPAPRTTTVAPRTTTPPKTSLPTSASPTTKASPKPTHKPTPVVTTSSPPLTGGTVTMGNFMYAMPSSVAPGARIAIYNADNVAHTLTITSAGIDVVVAGNSAGYFTAPATPGSYAITCDYHADMTATLLVK
jgi:plastocyanin